MFYFLTTEDTENTEIIKQSKFCVFRDFRGYHPLKSILQHYCY